VSSHPFYACHISICSKVLEIGCEQFSAAVCTSRRVYITQVSMDKNVSKRNYSLLTLVPRILQQQKEIITERSVETILFVIALPKEPWQVEKHNRSPWGMFHPVNSLVFTSDWWLIYQVKLDFLKFRQRHIKGTLKLKLF
jgi:hypothetical protein